MRRRLLGGLLCVCALWACEGTQVNNDGRYAFLPGAPVNDTNAWPLEHLLLIEQDLASGQSLFYYFSGDLGRADLGLAALERIQMGYERFRVRFDYPLDVYTNPPGAAGAGGAAGAAEQGGAEASSTRAAGGAAGSGATAGDFVLLTTGNYSIQLRALDATALYRVGAARYLTQLETGQYSIRAYFGALDDPEPQPPFVVESPAGDLRYAGALPALEPELSLESELSVSYQALADYVEVDLYQRLERISDDFPVESMVRISTPPQATVSYDAKTLEGSAYSNCWSAERPLLLRTTQIARYYASRVRGDFAVEHQRHDVTQLDAEWWPDLIQDVSAPGYCAGYR